MYTTDFLPQIVKARNLAGGHTVVQRRVPVYQNYYTPCNMASFHNLKFQNLTKLKSIHSCTLRVYD